MQEPLKIEGIPWEKGKPLGFHEDQEEGSEIL
jgi:hypothetical protein